MRIVPASDSSLLIVVADDITDASSTAVVQLFHAMHGLRDRRIRNLHPAYGSLLIDFDPLLTAHEEVSRIVLDLAASLDVGSSTTANTIMIPACYEGEFAPDLSAVAQHAGLSIDEVVRIHSGAEYVVSFLGFAPGFGYLAGMPEQLAMPRHATPRRSVAAGSVGIAGNQTGVYPLVSPGGWQIIGRTPLRMFDPNSHPPTRLQVGDKVQFRCIAHDEFLALQAESARDN